MPLFELRVADPQWESEPETDTMPVMAAVEFETAEPSMMSIAATETTHDHRLQRVLNLISQTRDSVRSRKTSKLYFAA